MSDMKTLVVALAKATKEFTTATNAIDKATVNADTVTDKILIVAIDAGSLEEWDKLRAEFDKGVRILTTEKQVNAQGYIIEEREDSGGNKTLVRVPGAYLAVIFSTIRQTYVRGLKFTDGRGERLTHHALKVNKAAHQKKLTKGLKGRKGDMRDLAEVLGTYKARAKNLNDEDLHNLVVRLRTEVKAMPTSKAA